MWVEPWDGAIAVECLKIVFVRYYHANSIISSITCSVHSDIDRFEINSTCNAQNNNWLHLLLYKKLLILNTTVDRAVTYTTAVITALLFLFGANIVFI